MTNREANGDSQNNSDNSNGKRKRSVTSSPSGRSVTPVSVDSDASRRRIEEDTVKEPHRSVSPKSKRRSHNSKAKSRSRSPSPKRSKKRSKESPSRSRSPSVRRRTRSRSRNRDDRNRNGRDRRDDRVQRRSRSPRYNPRRSRRALERENPKPSRCIGVFGLSIRTREKDLRAEFERYGPLNNIQLIHDHKSGRSRGFGFIYFTYLEDAEKARTSANGMILDDRKIRVDFSLTDRNKSPRRERNSRSRSLERRRRSVSHS